MFIPTTKYPTHQLLSIALILAVSIYSCTFAHADSVILTFSTVGDSRQDPQSPDATVKQSAQLNVGNCPIPSGTGLTPNPGLSGQDCKWLQNTKAWTRIMNEIQTQKANLLFFNGDMIMGYGKAGVPVTRNSTGVNEAVVTNPSIDQVITSDLVQFYQQYGFWRGMVATMMEKGTYIVPVPGNHEVQCKRCGKKAVVENENAWRDNMGDLVIDQTRMNSLLSSTTSVSWDINNTPVIGGVDGITTDQKQLSYSFDIGKSHFVVINTDAVGKDSTAPTAWLDADLTAAKNKGAKSFFVFGHKPAFFYLYAGAPAIGSTSSLDGKDPAAAKAFWNVITKYKATYFCGHEHIYKLDKFLSPDGSGNSAYQVLVGTGGSPFDAATPTKVATDRMYAWATVKIYKSGKVVMNTYGIDDTLGKKVVTIDKNVKLPTW